MTRKLTSELREEYATLRSEVDVKTNELFSRFPVSCRKGCSSCCTGIAISAVERAIIEERVDESGFIGGEVSSDVNPSRCHFLIDDACAIYLDRPIICMVHGLPLAYRVIEYDERGEIRSRSERSITYCDLNFTDRTPGDFRTDEVFDIASIFDKLDSLDLRYRRNDS